MVLIFESFQNQAICLNNYNRNRFFKFVFATIKAMWTILLKYMTY